MVDNFTGQVFGRYSLQAPAIVDVLLDSAPAQFYHPVNNPPLVFVTTSLTVLSYQLQL